MGAVDLSWIDRLPAEQQAALLASAQSILNRTKLLDYRAYPRQREFHRAGADPKVRERLLKAGNQLGKTWSAGFETAMHLTGRYPDWWDGAVFPHQVACWAAGVTGEVTRDTVQRVLCGRANEIGTGAIPADAIKDKAMKRGVADAIDTLVIRHGGGGDVLRCGVPHHVYHHGDGQWAAPLYAVGGGQLVQQVRAQALLFE